MKSLKNIKYVFALAVAFVATSCDKELDIAPQNSLLTGASVATEANVINIMNGIYNEAAQVASYGGRAHMAADLLGNSNQVTWDGTFSQPREYINKRMLAANAYVSGLWTNQYEVANQALIVLENSSKITSNATLKQTVEGEAYLFSGLAYFDLVRYFGKQYVAGGANTQLGVPVLTKAVLNKDQITFPSRNTVKQVYDKIVADLTKAVNMLPNSNSRGAVYANKFVAQAVLARVYLQMGDYAKALAAANDVITNGGFQLAGAYGDAFNKGNDIKEYIFAWQVTAQSGTNGLNTFYAAEADGGRDGDIVINNAYVGMFDAADERGKFFYVAKGERLTQKFRNQFANVIFARLPEMYLVRAEANARLSSSVGATPLADVNTVRSRAKAPAKTAVTVADILKERQLELGFEGFLLHDLRRTQTNVGAINYNDDRLVMPIPQREIDVNKNLVQNPGY